MYLLHRIAVKRGFELLAEETIFGGGGGRRHRTRRGILPSLSIGGLRFSDVLVSTTAHEIEPLGRFHGLLGIAAFDGYRVTLDLKRRRLLLESVAPESAGSSYWMLTGQMLVRVEATGDRSGLFLFDTGASRTIVASAFVSTIDEAKVGPDTSVRAFGGRVASSIVRGVQLRFQELSSESSTLNAVDMSMRSRLGRVEISGYLGLDLLGRSRVVIDTRTRRVEVH